MGLRREGLALLGVTMLCLCVSALAISREEVDRDLAVKMVNPVSGFEGWIKEHKATYVQGTEEWRSRFRIWLTNLHKVIEYNKGNEAHWLTLNRFADLTQDEFRRKYLGLKRPPHALRTTEFSHASVDLRDIPDKVDWRDQNAVTEVKDQRDCGSCWSFSTTGAIEAINSIYGGELVSLSEQELMDCDTSRDHGCDGGWMDYAFEWIIRNGGITTEKDYPYVGHQTRCARNKVEHKVVSIDDYHDIPSSEDNLLKALSKQPVSVGIKANDMSFQFYGGGIYNADCGTDIDHGVLVVGYSTVPGDSYFLVKNSWGPSWGEDGYIKLALGKNGDSGQCGITTAASYPIKTSPNPDPQPEPAPGPGPDPAPGPDPSPEPSPDADVACNMFFSCPAGNTCCCTFGFSDICFFYACCPYDNGVCCEDHEHCCPSNAPICHAEVGKCEGDEGFTNMLKKTPAKTKWGFGSTQTKDAEEYLQIS